ncbi:MAG: hypothetical protein JNK12_07855 [Acidimicrobiales bacterium]|nr:hypothetical protein [Acidimicrobiales bacterium]
MPVAPRPPGGDDRSAAAGAAATALVVPGGSFLVGAIGMLDRFVDGLGGDGPDAAALLAARDRNVKIRRSGASVVRPSLRRAERELAEGAATEVEATGDEPPAQPSLFDD